jgi:hypothetical protein
MAAVRAADKIGAMTTRLQIATRIHFLLMKELGEGIRIERMLRERLYARDVLLVCDAIREPELNSLAKEFREADARPKYDSPQAAAWAADTSGFGMTVPPQDKPPGVAEPQLNWLDRWLGR